MAREEANFLKTLDRGEKLLSEIILELKQQSKSIISGESAFTLYDTFGFPLELTQEIASENQLTIDEAGFAEFMVKQRTRAKEAHETIDLTIQGALDQLAEHIERTEFLGYTAPVATAKIQVLLVNGISESAAEAGSTVQIVLDQTPFYAQSGGQIGDRGYISGDGVLVRVEDVKKEADFFIHFGFIERGTLLVGPRYRPN